MKMPFAGRFTITDHIAIQVHGDDTRRMHLRRWYARGGDKEMIPIAAANVARGATIKTRNFELMACLNNVFAKFGGRRIHRLRTRPATTDSFSIMAESRACGAVIGRVPAHVYSRRILLLYPWAVDALVVLPDPALYLHYQAIL